MTVDDEPLRQLLAWREAGRRCALATVVGTWGSSPRPNGSLLAVAEDGTFTGSVSGGCVEGAVIDAARATIIDNEPRLLDFTVGDERAWEVGLACGGRLHVFVQRWDERPAISDLLGERPCGLVTDLDSGRHATVTPERTMGDLALPDDITAITRRAIADDRSGRLNAPHDHLFVTVFNRPPRLVIVGAVHIAQALAPLAAAVGFEVAIVDPRRAFARAERFPDVRLVHLWPDEALATLDLDARTAVVTLTHDPKLDDPALTAALNSPAYYVGALGSAKTQGQRRARLAAAGFAAAALDRIHGPVGLDLGGRRPPEIAVAILAEVIAARYGRDVRRQIRPAKGEDGSA